LLYLNDSYTHESWRSTSFPCDYLCLFFHCFNKISECALVPE